MRGLFWFPQPAVSDPRYVFVRPPQDRMASDGRKSTCSAASECHSIVRKLRPADASATKKGIPTPRFGGWPARENCPNTGARGRPALHNEPSGRTVGPKRIPPAWRAETDPAMVHPCADCCGTPGYPRINMKSRDLPRAARASASQSNYVSGAFAQPIPRFPQEARRRRFPKENKTEHVHVPGALPRGGAHAGPRQFWKVGSFGKKTPQNGRSRLNSCRSGVCLHGFGLKLVGPMGMAHRDETRFGPRRSSLCSAPKVWLFSNF